ncbi:MAG: DHHA1 domain-containing protein, partial [Candidatus Ranarchaeia archaeon]
ELTWDLPVLQIQKNNPRIIIFLDIALETTPYIRQLTKRPRKGFAIDHHVTDEEAIPPNVTLYNPCHQGQAYLPTVYLTDKVIASLFEIAPFDFFPELTFIGTFADAGIGYEAGTYVVEKGLEDLLGWAEQNHSELLELLDFDGFVIPQAQHLSICFNYYIRDKGLIEANIQLVNSLDKKSSLFSFFEKIEKHYRYDSIELYELVQSILDDNEKNDEPVIVYFNKGKREGNGDIARLLVERLQKPTIVYSLLRTKEGERYLISGRAPRKTKKTVNLVPIFSKYGGGGHQKACGLRLEKDKLALFLDDVKMNL